MLPVTSGQSNLTKAASLLHMDGLMVFSRWRQCALLLNTFPWSHRNPNPKRHLEHFSHFCTAHGRASLYFTVGRTFPLPQNCPFPRRSGYLSNTWFLGPIRANNPNGISIDSVVFAQLTTVSPYFTMVRHFTLKVTPSHGGSGADPHVIFDIPWAHLSLQPKRHLCLFSHFCRAYYCDRQTDW